MNIERNSRIPNRLLTPDRLVKRLDAFANILAHGRWFDPSVNAVQTTQSFIEQIGGEHSSSDDDVEPIFNEIAFSFCATKEMGQEDGRLPAIPRYVITSSIAQDIDKSEIPENILDDMFKNAADGHSEGHDLLTEAGFGDVLEHQEWTDMSDEDSDNFDQFEIKREHEAEYTVLFDGTIDEYTLSYLYSFDNTTMHDVSYSRSSNSVLTAPVHYADNGAIDHRPVGASPLTLDTLNASLAKIDSEAEAFFLEQSLRDIERMTELPESEHIRRILSMVAVASSGYAPRRWYTRLRDVVRYHVDGRVKAIEDRITPFNSRV